MTLHDTSFAARTPPTVPAMQRARGAARVTLAADARGTYVREAYQSGSAKVRFPRVEPGDAFEATLINTAGGITGGDRFEWTVDVRDGAEATITSQAAERIYRRSNGVARIETRLTVGEGASLAWLPQETIVFDRSSMHRALTAEVHPTGRLLAAEAIVLGRAAMGEMVREINLTDAWRVRRGGRAIFADGLKLDGDAMVTLTGGATGSGAAAMATVILVASDVADRLDAARKAAAEAAGETGVSAWNGMLTARLIAPDGQTLRTDLERLIVALRRANMPRVWHC